MAYNTKRKKFPAEFAADSIDNTVPVGKLLDDLQHKNSKAYEFYCQTIRQRRTTKKNLQNLHCVLPGHPLNEFVDDWEGDVNSGYFEEFPYKSTKPKFITPLNNLEKLDPVAELIRLKNDWQNTNRSIRSAAVYSNLVEKYETLNEDVVHCPKHFVDIAAHLDSDPDPHFDSSYNWYYAGSGNMQLACVNWTDYILHSELNFLYLSRLNRDDMTIEHASGPKFDCGENNNILETICSKHNIVALRTKHKVFILKIIDSDSESEMRIEKLKVTESKIPFTSIAFDDFHNNILYITTLDNKLCIVNIDRMKGRSVIMKRKVKSIVDNWNSVTGSERTYYTHVTRDSVTIYDKRSNDSIHTWGDVKCVSDDVSCNDIHVTKQIEGTPSMYIGSDHHLFLMDLRCYSNRKPKVVQRWTHGMQCVPTIISTCSFRFNEELICLTSQWCEDMCLVKNQTSDKTFQLSGAMIPYRPPSILKTLDEAKQKLLCIDIYNPIDSRLCTSITGNVVVEHGEKYFILMQNSLGDISSHCLHPEHLEIFIEDDSAEQLHAWSKNYKNNKKNFEISSIVDISKIWRLLKNVPEDHKIGEGKYEFRRKTKFNEQEIYDAFENEEIDSGLLDEWMEKKNETAEEQSSLALNLHFSDSE